MAPQEMVSAGLSPGLVGGGSLRVAVCSGRTGYRREFLPVCPTLTASVEEIVLVLDGAPAHRSGKVAWPDGIEALPLPAYSPELNPAERLFEELRAWLANGIFETVEAIGDALTEALCPYWKRPEKLAQLTGYG